MKSITIQQKIKKTTLKNFRNHFKKAFENKSVCMFFFVIQQDEEIAFLFLILLQLILLQL